MEKSQIGFRGQLLNPSTLRRYLLARAAAGFGAHPGKLWPPKNVRQYNDGDNADPLNGVDPAKDALRFGVRLDVLFCRRGFRRSPQKPERGSDQRRRNHGHDSAGHDVEPAQGHKTSTQPEGPEAPKK